MFSYQMTHFRRDIDILAAMVQKSCQIYNHKYSAIYGVPQGGVVPAQALSNLLKIKLTTDYKKYKAKNILIVDDLMDSGQTIKAFANYDVAVLGKKSNTLERKSKKQTFIGGDFPDEWIHFWWEPSVEKGVGGIHDNVTRILEYIGENPSREGLVETPKRIVKSWGKLFEGYGQQPKNIMKIFADGACDEMVLLKDIELYSMCEHHMLPFFGKCHIAYIPNHKVIGISKLARLMEIYARRMQIQERIGDQITTALMKYLEPLGAACIIEAQHFCMKARGIEKQNSIMVTSSLKGVFLEQPEVRAEFMRLIR